METLLEITKSELIEAFRKWNEDYKSNPDDYNSKDVEPNPVDQAEALINFLNL